MQRRQTALRFLIATVLAASVSGSLVIPLLWSIGTPGGVPMGITAGIMLAPALILVGAATATIVWGPIILVCGALLWTAGNRWPRLRRRSVWTIASALLAPLTGHAIPGWLVGNPFDSPLLALSFALGGALCARLFLGSMTTAAAGDPIMFTPPPATATAPSARPNPRFPPA